MWPNPQFPADLVTFTEEIFDRKLFFCAVKFKHNSIKSSNIDSWNVPKYVSLSCKNFPIPQKQPPKVFCKKSCS